MAERTVRFGEEQIVYCLERKTVKNINLRVRRDGVVAVSAGAWVPAERIDAFVVSKGERILAANTLGNEILEATRYVRSSRPA